MANNINDLDISKFFGVDVSTDTIKQTKIHIPKEAWDEINTKMETYRKVIKENRHSGVRDKVKSTLKTGDLSDKEKDRRKKLTTIFQNTAMWMREARTFFKGCALNKKVASNYDEISDDIEKLLDKGYLNDIGFKFEHFNKSQYSLPTKYENEPYSTQIVHIYNNLYKELHATLNEKDETFKGLLKQADQTRKDYIKRLSLLSNEISEKFKAYEERYSNIEQIISENYSRNNEKEFVTKKNKLIATYTSCHNDMKKLLQKIKSMNARVNFLHYFDTEYYVRNVSEVLQVCSNEIDEFSDIVTKNGYEFKKLKGKYDSIKEDLEKSKEYLKNLFEKHSKSKESKTSITRMIIDIDTQIFNKSSEFDAQIEKFDASLAKLDAEYGEWQKQQNEKKKRTALLAVFMAFGAVSAAISGLFPIIDALIFPTKPDFGSYSG